MIILESIFEKIAGLHNTSLIVRGIRSINYDSRFATACRL